MNGRVAAAAAVGGLAIGSGAVLLAGDVGYGAVWAASTELDSDAGRDAFDLDPAVKVFQLIKEGATAFPDLVE